MEKMSFKEDRINKILCRFENSAIEEEFRESDWYKYSAYIPFIMAITACAPLALLISGILSQDAGNLILSHLHNSFYVLVLAFLAFINDEMRKKYLPWFLLIIFSIVLISL